MGVFNIQTQETEKTKLCAAGFSTVDETTPRVSKPCRPNNLGSTHSGCLYWDILPLVLVSYSNPAKIL